MIFGTDHYGSDYVDLVGTPDQPRASVGRLWAEELGRIDERESSGE